MRIGVKTTKHGHTIDCAQCGSDFYYAMPGDTILYIPEMGIEYELCPDCAVNATLEQRITYSRN